MDTPNERKKRKKIGTEFEESVQVCEGVKVTVRPKRGSNRLTLIVEQDAPRIESETIVILQEGDGI